MARKAIAQNMKAVVLHRDLQNLVHEVSIGDVVHSLIKQFNLHAQIHPRRPVEANQAGMDGHIGILPLAAGSGRGSSKIDGVPGHKSPIAFDDEWL